MSNKRWIPGQLPDAQRSRRTKMLDDFLSNLDAACVHRAKVPTHHGNRIWELWLCKGKTFFVEVLEDDNGWDIYIPAFSGNSSTGTLDALRKYLES